jgi:hypothetical protein
VTDAHRLRPMRLSRITYRCVVIYRVAWTFVREASAKRNFALASIVRKLSGTNLILSSFWPSQVTKSATISIKGVTTSGVSMQQQNKSDFVGPIEHTIREKLLKACSPVTYLAVLNESHRHNVYVSW